MSRERVCLQGDLVLDGLLRTMIADSCGRDVFVRRSYSRYFFVCSLFEAHFHLRVCLSFVVAMHARDRSLNAFLKI